MKALFCLYSAPLIEGTSASSAPLASNLCREGLGWETGLGALGVLPPSPPHCGCRTLRGHKFSQSNSYQPVHLGFACNCNV